jgi:hypothetical protein
MAKEPQDSNIQMQGMASIIPELFPKTPFTASFASTKYIYEQHSQ